MMSRERPIKSAAPWPFPQPPSEFAASALPWPDVLYMFTSLVSEWRRGLSVYIGTEQLAFDFGVRQRQGAPYAAHRMFFAALPEPEAARRITAYTADLRLAHHLTGRARPTRLLHVSLAGVDAFGRLSEPIVAAAMQAGAKVRMAPFDVRFGRVMSFDGHLRPGQRRAIVLRCDHGEQEFTHLRRAIGTAMRSARVGHGLRPAFAPHVTLLYDEERVPEMALPDPIGWTVREFVLVHSVVRRGQHIHLARWQLEG